MERDIEYIGTNALNGEEVIGYFYKSSDGRHRIFDGVSVKTIVEGSQRQLIARDKNGAKVYEEDDVCEIGSCDVYPATFRDIADIEDGKVVKVT